MKHHSINNVSEREAIRQCHETDKLAEHQLTPFRNDITDKVDYQCLTMTDLGSDEEIKNNCESPPYPELGIWPKGKYHDKANVCVQPEKTMPFSSFADGPRDYTPQLICLGLGVVGLWYAGFCSECWGFHNSKSCPGTQSRRGGKRYYYN